MKTGSERIEAIEEQSICVSCGFCCDATLFMHACLNPGERGHLPEKIEENSFTEGGEDYFMQPCPYFSGKCTIYIFRRADICSSYRCQLLKDFAAGTLSLHEAMEIVSGAMGLRTKIMEECQGKPGVCAFTSFRQLMKDLGKMSKAAKTDSQVLDYEILLARCNIFEALLIKHFRPAGEFEKMMVRQEDKIK